MSLFRARAGPWFSLPRVEIVQPDSSYRQRIVRIPLQHPDNIQKVSFPKIHLANSPSVLLLGCYWRSGIFWITIQYKSLVCCQSQGLLVLMCRELLVPIQQAVRYELQLMIA